MLEIRMQDQAVLICVPPQDWIVGQVVVFDWFDGPRQGVARLAKPEFEFAFELLAERHNPDGLDDRLFRVSELPPGSVAAILEAIRPLGSPTNAVWVPLWKFENEADELRAGREIDRVLKQKKNTGLVIYSRDMSKFLACWQDDRVEGQVEDWFSSAGIL